MKNKKIIYKIVSILIVLAIFFFLGKSLVDNWQKVKDYKFSFNYFYLFISFIFLFGSLLWPAIIWNKILRILEPDKRISNLKAIKICIYSCFGRYIPGKVWMCVGKIFFGVKEGLSKRYLIISAVYEIILAATSYFIFSAVLISIAFGSKLFNFYIIPILTIIVGLIFIHPKILIYFYNLIPNKFKIVELAINDFLDYGNILKLVFYYSIGCFLSGVGFFFLIRSIVFLPYFYMIEVIGVYILALILGAVAIFAPGGLGVREGMLVMFLKLFFPISVAILISLLARIWTVLGELIVLNSVFYFSKLKKDE